MSGVGSRRVFGLPLVGLLLVAALATWGADRGRGEYFSTADEPEHVKACRELRSGPGVVSNFEHPVLMKVLGAAGLPAQPAVSTLKEVRAARRAFPFAFGLLVLVAGVWASARIGPIAGLVVAALVAIDPTLRGHAPLVHTDILLTALLAAAAACLDLSGPPRAPRRGLLVASGVAYGLALAAKYSALPFLPVFLGVAVIRLHGLSGRAAPEPKRKGRRRDAPGRAPSPTWRAAGARALALVALPALLTGTIVQQVVVASTTSRDELARGIDRKFTGFPYRKEAVRAASTLPRGLAAYAAGLRWVQVSSVPGARVNYFLGKVSGKGSFFYFPVALSIKLTTAVVLGLLAAAAAAAVALIRRGAAGGRRRLRVLAARGTLPFVLGAAYLGAAMISDVNIGVRHVAPAVPLFLVSAAAVLQTMTRRRIRIAVGVIVVGLAALEAAPFLGREIPFGNLLAGGPPGVRKVLSDSNVDWGEHLGEVFARASAGDLGRVGVASLFPDLQAAADAGVVWMIDDFVPGQVDTLFVSVFVWDVGLALESNRESFPKIDFIRGWLAPFMRRVREEAASVEPFGDQYLLVRLRPVPSPPAPGR